MADLASFFGGGIGGLGGSIFDGIKYALYLVPVILFIAILIIHFRNKSIYKYPVRVFKVRERGKTIETNYKGGYIGRKNSAPFFRIKTGMWWWNFIDLTKTPNPKYLDEQDRVYYKQIDVDTYIQLRRKFDNKGIVLSPVEPDIKYGAILAIQRIKEVLRAEPAWKKILPYVGLVLTAVVLVAGYAILLNTKCP